MRSSTGNARTKSNGGYTMLLAITNWLFLLDGGGLNKIYEPLINNWVGPAFLIIVAIFSLVFIKNRQFRELAAFVGIAVIVALLVYFGKELFSKEEGVLTKEAKKLTESLEFAWTQIKSSFANFKHIISLN